MLGTDSSDGRIYFFFNFESFEPVCCKMIHTQVTPAGQNCVNSGQNINKAAYFYILI